MTIQLIQGNHTLQDDLKRHYLQPFRSQNLSSMDGCDFFWLNGYSKDFSWF